MAGRYAAYDTGSGKAAVHMVNAWAVKNRLVLGRFHCDASLEEIVAAAKAANAHNFILDLPDGYDTPVGERGVRLSGGERQRISIARALVENPELLILDEATTALDPETEKKILETIQRLTDEGLTIIAVSHQPAVLEVADTTYRLDKGNLVKVRSKEEIQTA